MARVGKKRSDRRWQAPDGTVWASKFEYTVFDALTRAGCDVRKCDQGDTVDYVEHKRHCSCLECGGHQIVQERKYTPDLHYTQAFRGTTPRSLHSYGQRHYPIEIKGYFRAEKRSLFRALVNSLPTYPIRVILERDGWVTKGKTRYTDYFRRFLKTVPVHVWDGDIPDSWQ